MGTYATEAEFVAYSEGFVVDDSAALERLIQRAERDIDSITGPLWSSTVTVGAQTLPRSTIDVGSTAYFPASGTVFIAGQSVTYTGKTSKSLTGATGGTGEIVAGAIVARSTSLKFTVTQLTSVQRGALTRATCAQVEYRFTMGERFFMEAQYRQVSGPDFSQVGQLPYIGPKVWRELEGFGLLTEVSIG